MAKNYANSGLTTAFYLLAQNVSPAISPGAKFVRKVETVQIPEAWQVAHFGHAGIDPNADPDHDGMSNLAEYLSGTDPLDSNSYFAIQSLVILEGGHAQIRWQTVQGKTYTVLYSDDLITWNVLVNPALGDGSMFTATDPATTQQAPHRSYRVYLTN